MTPDTFPTDAKAPPAVTSGAKFVPSTAIKGVVRYDDYLHLIVR